MSKSASSRRWLNRQHRDPFVREARDSEYRSRAAFKLQEIDQRDRLFHPGQIVVDLGAAPGSWSQYAERRVGPRGRVIAVDILELEPIKGVDVIHGDFSQTATLNACLEVLSGAQVDLVISDLAPNLSGIRATDQARSLDLAELAYDFSRRTLRPGGDLLLKLFQGAGVDLFRNEIKQHFHKVMVRKPRASRDASREFYVLARSYAV